MDPKIPYLGNLKTELQKATVIFEISTLKFAKMPSFIHKQKTWNHGLKILHSGVLEMEFEEKLLPYSKSAPLYTSKEENFARKKFRESWKKFLVTDF